MVHLLLLLNCLFIVTGSYAAPATDSSSEIHGFSGGIAPMLKLLANVDGKAFFQESGINRNWTTAKIYCESFGMTLASITSQAQFGALQNAYGSDFDHWYWISGRDSFEITQFVWDKTGSQLSTLYLPIRNLENLPYQTCLGFRSLPNNSSVLGTYECD